MTPNILPFIDSESTTGLRDAEMQVEIVDERLRRQQTSAGKDLDEKLGLERLAMLINTIRMSEGLGWIEFALSAYPKPFNPVYLILISERLIARKEITDEVFDALERRLLIDASTLRGMFSLEQVEQPKGLLRWMRMPSIRISAPFDTFAVPNPVATLGNASSEVTDYRIREGVFGEAGLIVRYTRTPESSLVVNVDVVPESNQRVPSDLKVTVVSSVDGSAKAGPFRFESGRADFGGVDWDPLDRLVIERD